jgi:hypothetical protein
VDAVGDPAGDVNAEAAQVQQLNPMAGLAPAIVFLTTGTDGPFIQRSRVYPRSEY